MYAGPPLVIVKMIGNRAENTQITQTMTEYSILRPSMGIIILNILWKKDAPSMVAASKMLESMFENPPANIKPCQPTFIQTRQKMMIGIAVVALPNQSRTNDGRPIISITLLKIGRAHV